MRLLSSYLLGASLGAVAESGRVISSQVWYWTFPKPWCLLSQQSSNSKKEKDSLEDKKRNPILKYIGKPKSSSQSSEYSGGHQPRTRTSASAQTQRLRLPLAPPLSSPCHAQGSLREVPGAASELPLLGPTGN